MDFSLFFFQEIICQKNTVSTRGISFFSRCLSHIAHTLHTLCSAKNMLFTARREHSVLLPYVSLFAIVKAFFCTAHFCFEAVINI